MSSAVPVQVIEPQKNCPACHCEMLGRYCYACGEEQRDPKELTLRHFLGEVAQELTHYDSKLISTAIHLLFHPGVLTSEYLAGCRKKYIAPLKLFLTVFAFHFFLFTFYPPAAAYDVRTFEREADVFGILKGEIADKAKQSHLTQDQMVSRINQQWQSIDRSLKWLLVVGAVLCLKLAFRNRPIGAHIVFALHYTTFSLLLEIVRWPLIAWLGIGIHWQNWATVLPAAAVDLVYLVIALRRVYSGRTMSLIAKAAFISFGTLNVDAITTVAALFFAIYRAH